MKQTVHTSAPGRICLFGEHQDYLGLPVVAMAVNLRFHIEYRAQARGDFLIQTPDIDSAGRTLDIHSQKPANNEDYCWGIARALMEEGFKFPAGGEAVFQSGIPVRAGCSSSSAMSAAWMRLLIEIGDHPEKDKYRKNPELAAYLVYRGEKELFAGAGGMMDQYSCYLGGLLYVYPDPGKKIPFGVERLRQIPEGIILIDSGVPKDTQGILASVGSRARRAIEIISKQYLEFDISRTTIIDFDKMTAGNDDSNIHMVKQQLRNRDICQEGLTQLRTKIDPKKFGALLNEEHSILSRTLGISTPRIDQIQQLTLELGALGAKINGSGGGGTLFCYAPGCEKKISDRLETEKINHFVVTAGEGARLE